MASAKQFFLSYATKSDSDDFARKATTDLGAGVEDGPSAFETMQMLDPLLHHLAASVCRISSDERAVKGWNVSTHFAEECQRLEESGEMEQVKARASDVIPLHWPTADQ